MESNLTHTFLQLGMGCGICPSPPLRAQPHPTSSRQELTNWALPSQVPENLVSPRTCSLGPPADNGGPTPAKSAPTERGGQDPMRGGPRVAGVWTFLKDQSCLDSS